MPRYDYVCLKCEQTFTIRHSIKEAVEVCECEEQGQMQKIPTIPRIVKKNNAGKIVKKHLEEAKKEIKEFKQDMSKEMS
jgi:putative FmdB family regulatory protein